MRSVQPNELIVNMSDTDFFFLWHVHKISSLLECENCLNLLEKQVKLFPKCRVHIYTDLFQHMPILMETKTKFHQKIPMMQTKNIPTKDNRALTGVQIFTRFLNIKACFKLAKSGAGRTGNGTKSGKRGRSVWT